MKTSTLPLEPDRLRRLCLEAGADDVGFTDLDRPAFNDEREDVRNALPGARALIGFACRMNREPLRSPARSLANAEFHHVGDEVNEVGRRIVAALERDGIRALNVTMGFPMEMDRFPGKVWILSHKRVAEEAGLGVMGIHRNVIHPRFGSFILLGTVVVAGEIPDRDRSLKFNPCLECKLCVTACPVGAIGPDGRFDFSACYTHNYREFMGGFTDWMETVADSRDAKALRHRVSDSESASMWQSLSFGANYKAAYCLAVCPAGDDVIAPFRADRKEFTRRVVKPLQAKEEPVYVLADSDAEAHVKKRFPHKRLRRVGNSLRPDSVAGFLASLRLVFQPGKAADLDATYHFTFTGEETAQATVVIRDQEVAVSDGHRGRPDLSVTADSRTWIRFLRRELSIAWALLTFRVRIKGPPKLLLAFGRCFPG